MTIKQALLQYHKVEIELLLAHTLKKPKEFLFMHPEFILTSKHLNILSKYITRRQKGVPVAYLLGYKDFMGLRFKVNKNVLIPRPETEDLVHKIYQVCKVHKVGEQLRILDLGTGSGCIAVSLAKLLPSVIDNSKFTIYASDISKKALEVARQNARNQGVKIKFIHTNLFKNVNTKFDIIAANLPYVPIADYKKLKAGLKFEPKTALTDNTNKWLIYEKFFKEVAVHIKPDGYIFLEIDPLAKPILQVWGSKCLPKAEMKFYKDLSGLWRYVEIKSKAQPVVEPFKR